MRGLASVSLGAGATWRDDAPFQWSGSAGYAPFLTEHWQVGAVLGAAGLGRNGSLSGTTIGSATVLANYWVGSNRRSRPHIGAYAAAGDGTRSSGVTMWGAGVGWSHFVTPFTALDASLTGTRYSYGPETHTALRVSLQPYAFGRAGREFASGARPQVRGALDLVVDANAALSPVRVYTLRLGAAPFLFRALQVGGTVDASHWRDRDLTGRVQGFTDRALEGFARLYCPTDGRLHPFVGAFASAGRRDFGPARHGSRGASVGVRAYPNPGLALDFFIEQRHFTEPDAPAGMSRRPDRPSVRVALTPHLPRRTGP